MKIVIIANTVYTNTLTGGDKIFVECAKRWIKKGHSVLIITNEAGRDYCLQNGIRKKNISVWSNSWADRYGVYVSMIVKTMVSVVSAFTRTYQKADIVFAASFFVPDIVPAFFLKLKNTSSKLVTENYLFSYEKWGRDYSGGKMKGFLFYLNETIAFFIMKRYGNAYLTASSYDRKQFIKKRDFPASKVLAIRGGVDNAFFSSIAEQAILYDAVFVGRFHPQKSVDELISIWEMVVKEEPERVLAIVGNGPLRNQLRDLVQQKKLEKNILFLGAQDGVRKTKILKSSRLFLSASRFDSGNIALDEALSCGVPGVVYDLVRLDYPRGVVKIPVNNQKKFADAILSLLSNEKKRKKMEDAARSFALTLDWDKKASELLKFVQKSRN